MCSLFEVCLSKAVLHKTSLIVADGAVQEAHVGKSADVDPAALHAKYAINRATFQRGDERRTGSPVGYSGLFSG